MNVRDVLAGVALLESGRQAARPGSSRRHLVITAVLRAVFAAGLLTAAACAGPGAPPPAPDHGFVAGHLTIPFRPPATAAAADIIAITVSAGQRFSIKVDTSDGPYYWSQAGPGPDSRLLRLAGDFNDGKCAPALVGCRVPYFHTLIARVRGTTAMSWRYHDLTCPAAPKTASPPGGSCPAVTTVTFDITIR
jgi:hypothetical protein